MKISIIGCGKVGSTTAFALLYSVRPEEIMLYDRNKNRAEAEELDLGHAAAAVSPRTRVKSSTNIRDIRGSDIVIITAGKSRTPGSDEIRESLAEINGPIIRGFVQQIMKVAPEAQIIIVTNPPTQMGGVAREFTNKITVMDNQLDTARLGYYISKEGFKDIKSEVRGEHGENMQFEFRDNLTKKQKEKVSRLTKETGRKIVDKKGYTNWGIASQICEAIKRFKKI